MQISEGRVEPEFQEVLNLFEAFLEEDPRYIAQVAVYVQGRKVVDLNGGADAAGTITGTYSCSKGVAACVVALLVQDGLLDLDCTVAHYWPEFGAHGKDQLTVRQALSHQAGLLGTTTAVSGCPAISTSSLGCRRARSRATGMFCTTAMQRNHGWTPSALRGSTGNAAVSSIMELPNHREVRAAGMSSAGGVGSADGLARLYAAAITGIEGTAPFLTEETTRAMAQEQVWGLDRTSGVDNAFAVVFMKPHPSRNFGSHLAFGHEGASAALGFADPAYGIGFGYVPRRREEGLTTGRAHRLALAVRQAAASL